MNVSGSHVPWRYEASFQLGRTFCGPQRFQFRAEFFNFFNYPNFGQPAGISFTSSTSVIPDGPRNGEIRSLRTPMRVIQFGAKVYF